MAKWHVSGRDCWLVYDEHYMLIAECQSRDQAERIVAAVNAEEELKLLRDVAIKSEIYLNEATDCLGTNQYPITASSNLLLALRALDALRKERDGEGK